MFVHLEGLGFGVKVVGISHSDTPGGDAQGGVLNDL